MKINKIGSEGIKKQVIKPVWWEAVPTLLTIQQRALLPSRRFYLAALADETAVILVCCANEQPTNSLTGL